MPITLEGVGSHWDSSQTIRRKYADSGEPVILSFSRGKDSIAAWLALLDDGVQPSQIHPIYYDTAPGMRFIREDLDYWEEQFEQHITVLPSPALYGMLFSFVYQPPTRTGYIEALIAAVGKPPTYQELEQLYRQGKNLPDSTPVLTGVRASDSIARSTYIKRSGPYSAEKKRMATIWDWTQTECYERIADAGLRLPIDYEWFKRNGRKNSGRSFDGVAYQFTRGLKENAPDDYAVLKEWFPLIDLDHFRHESLGENAVSF